MDTTAVDNLLASNRLLQFRVLLLSLFIIVYTAVITNQAYTYFYNLDSFTVILEIASSTGNGLQTAGVCGGLLQSLAIGYMTINSFEFLILNLYMLLALVTLHLIKMALHRYRLISHLGNAARILRDVRLVVTPMRYSSQSKVYTRCITLNRAIVRMGNS